MPEMQTGARSFLSTADKSRFYSIFGAFTAMLLLLLLYAASKGRVESGGFLAILVPSLVFPIVGAMFFVDSSELLVSDTGLARKIFGGVRMQIPWTGIKGIREIFRINTRNGPQIIIQIMPIVRSGGLLRFRRVLVISDQFEGFDELIELVNAKIEQYSIRVEIGSGGIWKQGFKLVAKR